MLCRSLANAFETPDAQGLNKTKDEALLEVLPLEEKFAVPEDLYKYSPSKNSDPDSAILSLLNKTSDFDEATETVIPRDALRAQLLEIRNSLQGCSAACDRMAKSLAKIDGNADYVHKSVNVKTAIQIPFGAKDFPQLQVMYEGIQASMDALNAEYRSRGTALITQALRVKAFQLRIERAKLLYNQLITMVTQFHISFYREANKSSHKYNQEKPPKSPVQLATLVIFNVIQILDLEILQYLDINRDILSELFLREHTVITKPSLNQLDSNSVDYALTATIGYIKSITVAHYKRTSEKERRAAAEAKVKALMKAAKGQNTMTALDEVIGSDCTMLPTDSPLLEKAVLQIVEKHKRKTAQKRAKFAKRNHKTAHKRKTTGIANQIPTGATKKGPKKAKQAQR